MLLRTRHNAERWDVGQFVKVSRVEVGKIKQLVQLSVNLRVIRVLLFDVLQINLQRGQQTHR